MRIPSLLILAFVCVSLNTPCSLDAAENPESISLPKPQTEGGVPLMKALKERKSERKFSPEALPEQTLSNLLWAACGVNRDDGRRTAPSACNWQEIDIYVAMPQGLYLYDAKGNKLSKILAQDIRALCGKQDFPKNAPLCLIFVADLKRMENAQEKDQLFYSATDTGFVSQNVYLFAASAGLNTVVLGYVDKDGLGAAMKLRPEQKIILTQPVGMPPKAEKKAE